MEIAMYHQIKVVIKYSVPKFSLFCSQILSLPCTLKKYCVLDTFNFLGLNVFALCPQQPRPPFVHVYGVGIQLYFLDAHICNFDDILFCSEVLIYGEIALSYARLGFR